MSEQKATHPNPTVARYIDETTAAVNRLMVQRHPEDHEDSRLAGELVYKTRRLARKAIQRRRGLR